MALPPSHLPRILPLRAALWFLPALLAGCGDPAPELSDGEPLLRTGLPLCAELGDPEPGSCRFATTGFYTSKEPYAPRQSPASLTPPPEGFQIVMVQHVARHGSRALSSPDDDDLMYQLWQQAEREGALTPLGELLGPVLEDVLRVHTELGYGLTSELGMLEHRETAHRLLERHPALFEAMEAEGRRIEVFHSGRERADESGEAFVHGLLARRPGLALLVDPAQPSFETLYFNAAEGSEAYEAYRRGDARMMAAMAAIEEHPNTRAMARLMLRSLFSEAFLDRLAAGEFRFHAAADPDDQISDEMDAAEAFYGLYSIAVGLREEADWEFGRFMHPEAAAWFAYLDDAGSFYNRGPGFSHEEVTFQRARVLVADMLKRIRRLAEGDGSHAVTLRFSHAQALMPLAAFLGIQGACEGAHPDTLYTYETNPWRSERVSPMAANVQWDVFRNGKGVILVRMLHQEGEVQFAPGCRPWEGTRYFYELGELERCYRPGG
jgi:hypothetical protein